MAVMLMPCQAFGAEPVTAELAMARYKALTTIQKIDDAKAKPAPTEGHPARRVAAPETKSCLTA